MRILGKKWLMLAAAVPVAALIACSSDAPVQVLTPSGQVYDEDEYNELVEAGMVDEMGNVIEEDEDDDDGDAAGTDTKKSSSSGSKTTSSSDSKTASSSDTKTESSSDSKTTSSDSKTESSSSAKASSDSGSDKSSSSAVTSSTGSEGTSSEGGSGETVKSSSSASGNATSSAGKDESSSAGTATSSSSVSGDATSSSSTVRQATLVDGSNFSVGTDDMKEVATETQSELDSLKEILDNGGTVDGFEESDIQFNEETMTVELFESSDVYCFTGEGEWLKITAELLGQYIPHFRNDHAWGNLRHFDIKFMDACAAVYIRRKS